MVGWRDRIGVALGEPGLYRLLSFCATTTNRYPFAASTAYRYVHTRDRSDPGAHVHPDF
jgi:hypothetical protein